MQAAAVKREPKLHARKDTINNTSKRFFHCARFRRHVDNKMTIRSVTRYEELHHTCLCQHPRSRHTEKNSLHESREEMVPQLEPVARRVVETFVEYAHANVELCLKTPTA